MVCRSVGSSGERTSQAPLAVASFDPATCQEVSFESEDAVTARVEVIMCLAFKTGFSREVEVVAFDLRGFTATHCQGKWSRFLHWCHGLNISSCKATILQ